MDITFNKWFEIVIKVKLEIHISQNFTKLGLVQLSSPAG